VWSNDAPFQVNALRVSAISPEVGAVGTAVTLVPNVVSLVEGETRTLQALSAGGQVVTGLAWTTSDANVVSLSSSDPPELTAVGAGRVTPELCTERGLRAPEGAVGALVGLRLPRVI
jgi:hypothetical protein